MKILLISFLSFFSFLAFADDPQCTTQPREKWLKTDVVKERAQKMGITLKMFKTTEYCYLVQGTDKFGKPVEMYFSPSTGRPFSIKK